MEGLIFQLDFHLPILWKG